MISLFQRILTATGRHPGILLVVGCLAGVCVALLIPWYERTLRPSEMDFNLFLSICCVACLLLGMFACRALEVATPRLWTGEDVLDATGSPLVDKLSISHSAKPLPLALKAATSPTPLGRAAQQLKRESENRHPPHDPSVAHGIIVVVAAVSSSASLAHTVGFLGRALAELGLPTLIVDADLSMRTLSHAMSAANQPGLANVLASKNPTSLASLKALILKQDFHRDLLPAGSIEEDPTPSSEALIASKAFEHALEVLTSEYAFVILSAPDHAIAPSAIALAGACDALLLAASYGKSRPKEARAILQALDPYQKLWTGTILTHCPKSQMRLD